MPDLIQCAFCDEPTEPEDMSRCALCGKRGCYECVEWHGDVDDECDGDYFCERCATE